MSGANWFAELPHKDFAPRITRLAPGAPEPPEPPLDPKWRMRAACRGRGLTPEGIAQWFPGPGGSQAGKVFCRVCPVSRECGAEADELGIEWGLWGGVIRQRKKPGSPDTQE